MNVAALYFLGLFGDCKQTLTNCPLGIGNCTKRKVSGVKK
jgi:hypothetical protein